MIKSIFLKIFSGYLLITLVLSGMIIAFLFKTIKTYHIESTAGHLQNLGVSLREQIAPLIQSKKNNELDVLVKRFGKEVHVRITVVATNGTVLADSEENPISMENHATRTEIAQAIEGNTGRFLRMSETLKEEMLYIALPVRHEAKIIGVLRLSLFLKDINTMIHNTRIKTLHISLLIMAISLVISFIFAKNLSKPIKELIAASISIANEDFSARVFLKNNDELEDLADSFNSMASRMKTLFEELSGQKEELDNIISSLQEGILVLDMENNVLLCNNSFRKIIHGEPAIGKPYWENLRIPEFDNLIKKIKDAKTGSSDEVSINNRVFLCNAAFSSAKEEIVIVFHDITDIKRVEKIKTDFVSNISHELRTPLTAIKGFVETMEDSAVSLEHRHYLDIIKRNTDRLSDIINDLLVLSELEEKSIKLDFAKVDLKSLSENILRFFEQKLNNKSLYFRLDIDNNLPHILADTFKLEQAFINLIDNAIKYTEKGGIILSVKNAGDSVKIIVEDTGIGIPNEHLSRIFERFYVVDKSRSKKLGGTGLGLSIVKHIVLLHNGQIDVQSIPGKGTKFIIVLPLSFP